MKSEKCVMRRGKTCGEFWIARKGGKEERRSITRERGNKWKLVSVERQKMKREKYGMRMRETRVKFGIARKGGKERSSMKRDRGKQVESWLEQRDRQGN